tara:strand:- start:98 stop:631 length:534 start_codon:yes stop_codon:yes gene_type:complete
MAVVVLGLAGLAMVANGKEAHSHGESASKAICVLTPTEGSSTSGTITFTKTDDGIMIEGMISGLTPESTHGFHIHQYGDISGADGKATGGHFNPHGMDHAGPDADMRHVGDLGNVVADKEGNATYKRLDKGIAFDGDNNIIGRGMILHAGTDDMKTQPTGDAGSRIAQGVIGIASAE